MSNLCKLRGPNRQYLALIISPFIFALVSNNVKDVSSDIWHFRLGHLSQSHMSLFHEFLPDIPCKNNDVCTVCPLARQRRLSFLPDEARFSILFGEKILQCCVIRVDDNF